MSIHYKFNSSKEAHTITFDNLHITLGDLKKAIMQQRKIGKCVGLDLQIINAQTKEVYENDSTLIPKNTSVIVARIPAANAPGKKHWNKQGNQQNDQSSSNKNVPTTSEAPIALEMKSNETEEEKIKKMMAQSTKDFDPSKYARGRGPVGPPNPNYTCYRCGRHGHYTKECPTHNLNVKRSTGIPRSFMIPAKADQKGAMMTANGEYVVHVVDLDGYKVEKKDKPPFLESEEKPELEKVEVPDDLKCPLCKELLQDAVLISCCGECFCDECIRLYLLESDNLQCPSCKETDVSPDTLIPSRYQRLAALKFKNEHGIEKSVARRIKELMKTIEPKENPPQEIKPEPLVKNEKPKESNKDQVSAGDGHKDSSETPAKAKEEEKSNKKDDVDMDDMILLDKQSLENKNPRDDPSQKQKDNQQVKESKTSQPSDSLPIQSLSSLPTLPPLPMPPPFPFGSFVGGQNSNKSFRFPIRVRSSTQVPIFNRPPGAAGPPPSLPPLPPPPPFLLPPMSGNRGRVPLLPGNPSAPYYNPMMYGQMSGLMIPPYGGYGPSMRNPMFQNQMYANRGVGNGGVPLLPYPGMPPYDLSSAGVRSFGVDKIPYGYGPYGGSGGDKKYNDYEDQLNRFNRQLESSYYHDERNRERRSDRRRSRSRSRSRTESSASSRSSDGGRKTGSSRRMSSSSSSRRNRERDRHERDVRRHRDSSSPRRGSSPPPASHREDRRSVHRDRHRRSPSNSKYDKRTYYDEPRRTSRTRSRDRGDSKRHKSSTSYQQPSAGYPERFSRDRSPPSPAADFGTPPGKYSDRDDYDEEEEEENRQQWQMSPDLYNSFERRMDGSLANYGYDCSNLIDIKLNGDENEEPSKNDNEKPNNDEEKGRDRKGSRSSSKDSEDKKTKSEDRHYKEKKESSSKRRRSNDTEHENDSDSDKEPAEKKSQIGGEKKKEHRDDRKSHHEQKKSERTKKKSSSKSSKQSSKSSSYKKDGEKALSKVSSPGDRKKSRKKSKDRDDELAIKDGMEWKERAKQVTEKKSSHRDRGDKSKNKKDQMKEELIGEKSVGVPPMDTKRSSSINDSAEEMAIKVVASTGREQPANNETGQQKQYSGAASSEYKNLSATLSFGIDQASDQQDQEKDFISPAWIGSQTKDPQPVSTKQADGNSGGDGNSQEIMKFEEDYGDLDFNESWTPTRDANRSTTSIDVGAENDDGGANMNPIGPEAVPVVMQQSNSDNASTYAEDSAAANKHKDQKLHQQETEKKEKNVKSKSNSSSRNSDNSSKNVDRDAEAAEKKNCGDNNGLKSKIVEKERKHHHLSGKDRDRKKDKDKERNRDKDKDKDHHNHRSSSSKHNDKKTKKDKDHRPEKSKDKRNEDEHRSKKWKHTKVLDQNYHPKVSSRVSFASRSVDKSEKPMRSTSSIVRKKKRKSEARRRARLREKYRKSFV